MTEHNYLEYKCLFVSNNSKFCKQLIYKYDNIKDDSRQHGNKIDLLLFVFLSSTVIQQLKVALFRIHFVINTSSIRSSFLRATWK